MLPLLTSFTTMSSSTSGRPAAATAQSSYRRLRNGELDALRLRRVFDLFDRDGDGIITPAELSGALGRLGLGRDTAYLEAVVAAYIAPGMPGLRFADFEALHGELGDAVLGAGADTAGDGGEQEEEEMREAFRVFDENGDGYISAAELQAVLARIGLPEAGSMARVRDMIAAADRDSDGRVDFPEFKAMMSGASAAPALRAGKRG